jgi:hypothetical protein
MEQKKILSAQLNGGERGKISISAVFTTHILSVIASIPKESKTNFKLL